LDLTSLTISGLSEKLLKKEVSSVEATKAYLDRIERVDGKIHAFLTVTADEALKSAEEADRRISSGENKNPLNGIPISVKDIFCTKGIKTTCASKILGNFVPPYDATVVARLKEAGAVILGKNNMDEFAMGSSTENSAFGPTRNPWDTSRVPGGSSGGSPRSRSCSWCPDRATGPRSSPSSEGASITRAVRPFPAGSGRGQGAAEGRGRPLTRLPPPASLYP